MNRSRNGLFPAALLAGLAGCAGPAEHGAFSDGASLRTAHAALVQGEAATALGIARGVLSLHPNDAGARAAAADAEAALGHRREAERLYRQALASAPGLVPARLGLARLAIAENPAAAESGLRALLRDAPRNAAALTDLGVALDLQQRHGAAQASYDAALAIDPNLASARVDLALSLALSGQPERAETLLQDAEGAVPEARWRADLALAQTLAGQDGAAEHTLAADLPAPAAHAAVVAMAALRAPNTGP